MDRAPAIPAPSPQARRDWARPACLPACLLTQICRSQAFSVPCLSPPNLLPHQFGSGTSLTGKGRKGW